MDRKKFEELYSREVLKRNKEPYHFASIYEADVQLEAYNPLCGDKYQLYLKEESDEGMGAAYFDGFGCALSKASTSLLMEIVEGRSREEVKSLCVCFIDAVDSGTPELLKEEELKLFADMKNFDGRLDCIKLSWQTLLDYLKKEE
ncbi:MAG: iron-sulfur cluster assembly scaffold protein [Bacteroidota bacterium]